MPKRSKPLTAKQIENAKPKGKDYSLPDGGGLGLVVTSKGSKLWRMRPRFGGKYIVLSFGEYPHVSLEQARKKRDEAKKLIAEGKDPRLAKKEQQTAKQETVFSFERLTRKLIESKKDKVTAGYLNQFVGGMEKHIFPVIGDRDIREIEGRELLDLFMSISHKQNNKGNPMTYIARKACQWSAEVFDFASIEIPGFYLNPCRAVIKHLPEHKHEKTKRIPFSQVGAFIRALDDFGGYPTTRAAIWMLLYTGMRQASVRRAEWADFDLEAGIWNRKPEKRDENIHVLPLPVQAVRMLESLKLISGQNRLVFPSEYANGRPIPFSDATITKAIRGMGFDMTGHGLRGVVTTGLNELSKQKKVFIRMGIDKSVVETQVGHIVHGVAGRYDDSKYLETRRKMMQVWADYLEGLKVGKITRIGKGVA